jgi:hemolysin III
VIGLVVAVPAVGALALSSTSGTAFRIALAVYGVGLCTMFGASATYHRWVHGLKARCTWRRVDHAAIFAAIAGSSTPILVAALPGAPGFVMIGLIWSAAFLGAGFKLSRWEGGDRAGVVMYVVTIVLSAVAVPWLWVRQGVGPAVLVVVGGVVYLVGAAGFAKRWPTLRPAVFSFHEVWHVFTVVAAATQFAAISRLAPG